jgi:lactate dehydrogenase-like 2-hydroxyacid dehydrogenase
MSPLVIVSHALPTEWLEKLRNHCELIVGPEKGDGLAPELEAHLPEVEGILTMLTVPVDEAFLARTPKLRVVSNMAVGVDNIDLAACVQRGIPVGHTPGVLVEGTADMTMTLLLAAARRLLEASGDARDGRWTTWTPTAWLGTDLNGATLGIVGMGKIGQAAAARAKAFGMKIVYNSRSRKPEAEAELEATYLELDELLAQSDFVSLHTPLTAETRHLIGEAALRRMKPTAILVNMARGPVVDTDALVQALQEGQIHAAALDVTDPEPLPANHILYSLNNCVIAPHIGSATWHTRRRMAELACENLLAGLDGRRLPHCANPQVYENL